MRARKAAFLVAVVLLAFPLLAAKKKKPVATEGKGEGRTAAAQITPHIVPMTADQKVVHALNRLTFGAKPADFSQVKEVGLEKWIDLQLHPERVEDSPLLFTKLQPLETLRMSSAEMLRKYPGRQQLKAIAEGRQPMPSEPPTKYMVEKAVARYQAKQALESSGADDSKDSPRPLTVALEPEQKRILDRGKPPEQAGMIAALPENEQWDVLDSLPQGVRQRMFSAAPPELRRKIQMFNGSQQVVNQDLIEGKILRAVYSNRQLEEVLTDFWFNHFNVYLDKGADRYFVTSYERDAIRPYVLGHFKDLLLATAQSPAMLFYLDNFQSVGPDTRPRPLGAKRRTGLNENYGRELMELHTLGVEGGYTQQDVTEVARCFTGWTIREPQRGGGFEFNARTHDNGEKHVLGVTIPAGGGMDDGLKVLDILDHHPSTAVFISRSLAIRFVSDNPPDAMVQRMAKTFQATDGDLREVMRTMLASPEFWDVSAFRSKVKSPVEMLVSSIRAVNGDVDFAFSVANQLNQLGEPLYRKAEPTGYSNKSGEWMNSASLLARMNFAVALAQNRVPGVKVDGSQFQGDNAQIERTILTTDASADARAAIEAGLQERAQGSVLAPTARPNNQPILPGALTAGLTLGSPDFQRR